MKYISLFSGIEAASVAWKTLGWEPLAFSEIDKFPSKVLATRYPQVPNLGDMTKVDWREYHGAVDLVVGGSPCQAFSVAGLRQALRDPRGQLMLEYLRACAEINPQWIVWENVPGVLSAEGGHALEAFLSAVAELWPDGGCAWRVLDARYFGVPQSRRRIFAVINTRDWRRTGAVLFDNWGCEGDSSAHQGTQREVVSSRNAGELGAWCAADSGTDSTVAHEIAPCLTAHDGNCAPIVWRPGMDVRRLTPVEAERLQGFPDGWTDVEWRGGEAPFSKRFKALGNSMAVPVMRWIGERIQLVEDFF